MHYSEMDALATMSGPETGPATPVNLTDCRTAYFKKCGFIKVRIDPDDGIINPDMRYRSVWHMYWAQKQWYEQELWRQLPSLFTAFLVLQIDKPFIAERPQADEAVRKKISELRNLCRTHYLIVPVLRIKKRKSPNSGLEVKLLGINPPVDYCRGRGVCLESHQIFIKDTYIYGNWVKFDDSRANLGNFIYASKNAWNTRYYSKLKANGKGFSELYQQFRDELEQIINDALMQSFGGLHAH